MATLKQIEANRLNARKSTGPRTSAGKAASSMNALKTGIDAASSVIRGEDPASLKLLAAEYHDRYQPSTPEQRALVDTLIYSDWLQRRLRTVEAQLWEQAFERQDHWESETDAPLGEAFANNSQSFSRLQRRIDSTQRNYQRALTELRRLQPTAVPEPPPQPIAVPIARRETGFVSPSLPLADSLQTSPSPGLPEPGALALHP